MKYMTNYLLSPDEQYDKQATMLRNCIHRAKEAELYTQKLHVQFAEAQDEQLPLKAMRLLSLKP
jgi:hypothetical protein